MSSQQLAFHRLRLTLAALFIFCMPAAQSILVFAQGTETVPYVAPDGSFRLHLPGDATQPEAIDSAEVANVFDGSETGFGFGFADAAQTPIATVVFARYPTDISSDLQWDTVLTTFAHNIGGPASIETNRTVQEQDGDYRALLELLVDKRRILARVEEDRGLVAAVVTSQPEYRSDNGQAPALLASFTWSPDEVRSNLRGEQQTAPFVDPAGVFKLAPPTGFRPEPMAAGTDSGYGFALSEPDSDRQILVRVGPAQNVWARSQGQVAPAIADFTPLTDDQWQAVVAASKQAFGDASTPKTLPLQANFRSTLLEFGEKRGNHALLWIEEIDGVVAMFALVTPNGDVGFADSVLPTYAWSPQQGRAVLASTMPDADAAIALARPFQGPFETFTLQLPDFLGFDRLTMDSDSASALFHEPEGESSLEVRFTNVGRSLTADEWPTIVASVSRQLTTHFSPSRSPTPVEIVGRDMDATTKRASLELTDGRLHGLAEIQERDGILTTVLATAPNEVWAERGQVLGTTLESLELDPMALSKLFSDGAGPGIIPFEARLDLGTQVLDESEVEGLRTLRMAPVEVSAVFSEPGLDGSLTLLVRHGEQVIGQVSTLLTPGNNPSATRDVHIVHSPDRVDARLTYWPTAPLPVGDDYAADLFYGDQLLTTSSFSIREPTLPVQAHLRQTRIIPDLRRENYVARSRLFAPIDTPTLSVDADYPEDSLTRVLWRDSDGILLDGIESRYHQHAQAGQRDTFQHSPLSGWQPGVYSVEIRIDGQAEGDAAFIVVDVGSNIEADLLAGLDWPAAVQETKTLTATSANEIRLHVNGGSRQGDQLSLAEETIALWDARLRAQGWQHMSVSTNADRLAARYDWEKNGDQLTAIISDNSQDGEDQSFDVSIHFLGPNADNAAPRPSFDPINAGNLSLLESILRFDHRDVAAYSHIAMVGKGSGTQAVTVQPAGAESPAVLDAFTILPFQGRYRFQPAASQLTHLDATPDGRFVAASTLEQTPPGLESAVTYLWRTDTWDLVTSFAGHEGRIEAQALAPYSGRLATASADGLVRVWSAAGKLPLVWQHAGNPSVSTLGWSADGETLFIGLENGQIEVWPMADPGPTPAFRVAAAPVQLLALPDNETGSQLAVLTDAGLELWQPTPEGAASLDSVPVAAPERIEQVLASHDGSWIATVGDFVQFYVVDEGAWKVAARTFGDQETRFVRGALSSDGTSLLLLDDEGVLHLLAVPDQR